MNIRTKLIKLLGRKKAARFTNKANPSEPTKNWESFSVPLHPPEPDQYPLVHYSQLLSRHAELITLIRQEFGLSDSRFDTEVMPIIEHAAKQLHLLPSSKEHHHHTQGGAFHHSLETASFCLRRSQTLNFNNRYPPYLHDEINENVKLALFIAGLWHDMGKPATDLSVTTNGESWSPFHETLFDFLNRHQVSHYQIVWKTKRNTELHNQMTPQFFGLFMSRLNIKLHSDIHGFLTSHYSGAENPFSTIIKRSDEDSTEKDLISVGTALQRPPVSTTVIESIRSLVQEDKRFELNGPSKILVLLTDGLYLKYPEGIISARDRLKNDEKTYLSIPTETNRVLQKLFSAGYISLLDTSVEASSEKRFLRSINTNDSSINITESSTRLYMKFAHPFIILDRIDTPLMEIDEETGEIAPFDKRFQGGDINGKAESPNHKKPADDGQPSNPESHKNNKPAKDPSLPPKSMEPVSDALSYVPDSFRPTPDLAKKEHETPKQQEFRLDKISELGYKFIEFISEDMDLDMLSDDIPKVNFTSSRVKSFRESYDVNLNPREITSELFTLGLITKKSYTNSYVQLTPSFANYLKRERINGTKN